MIGYKSAGFYLIYILDKNIVKNLAEDSEEFKIKSVDFKFGLNSYVKSKVMLLFFSKKYLNLYTLKGKIVKEIQ